MPKYSLKIETDLRIANENKKIIQNLLNIIDWGNLLFTDTENADYDEEHRI